MINVKATAILVAILAATTALVFIILYGIGGRGVEKTILPLPTDAAAKAYVLQHNLLTNVTLTELIKSGGPHFKMLHGTDEAGLEKLVWLTGKDNDITVRGMVHLREGLSRESILVKLNEMNITPEKIQSMHITPYDYTSNRIVWFIKENDIKKHMLSFDFKTGEFLWDVYEDPTAWKLSK